MDSHDAILVVEIMPRPVPKAPFAYNHCTLKR